MSPSTVIVHDLRQAKAAVAAAAELGVRLTLRSAPGAAAYLGATVFKEIVEQAADSRPEAAVDGVLDCGDDAGSALAALRHGIKRVALDAPDAAGDRVRDIAAQLGAAVEPSNGPALDVAGADDVKAAVRRWLDDRET